MLKQILSCGLFIGSWLSAAAHREYADSILFAGNLHDHYLVIEKDTAYHLHFYNHKYRTYRAQVLLRISEEVFSGDSGVVKRSGDEYRLERPATGLGKPRRIVFRKATEAQKIRWRQDYADARRSMDYVDRQLSGGTYRTFRNRSGTEPE